MSLRSLHIHRHPHKRPPILPLNSSRRIVSISKADEAVPFGLAVEGAEGDVEGGDGAVGGEAGAQAEFVGLPIEPVDEDDTGG